MAKGTLGQVIQRAISDAAFRNRLRTDPGGALSGFDLTPAERAALQSGDAAKLASFGVDQRMSKAFAMGEAASGVSRLVGTDIGMGAIITDGGTPLGTNAILDDAAGSGRSAIRDDGGPFDSGSVDAGTAASGGTSAFLTADEAGNDVVGSGDTASWRAAPIDGSPEGTVSSVAASDSGGGTSAFLTADEMGNDVVAGGAGTQASSVAASEGSATDAFLTADEMGNNVSANATTAGGGYDGPSGTAYLTADEAGRDQSANSDSATANPEGYAQPDPNAG